MKFGSILAVLLITPVAALADGSGLTSALQNTYRACVGIDEDLNEMKRMAGINTAITGLGTGLGVGATATGLSKANLDKKIEKWEDILAKKIAEQQASGNIPNKPISDEELNTLLAAFAIPEITETQTKIAQATAKSKKLGNWRTGLLVGDTVANVTGSVIAAKNRVDKDLQAKVTDCINGVNTLKNAIASARVAGYDIGEAQQIYDACREYEYIDLTPINKRATGAMVSSIAGAITAGIGTVTSAAANSDKIRTDNSDAGKAKEKKLNTASNVLAAGSTVASATATVFNASQIATIKKVAKVASECTEALK